MSTVVAISSTMMDIDVDVVEAVVIELLEYPLLKLHSSVVLIELYYNHEVKAV